MKRPWRKVVRTTKFETTIRCTKKGTKGVATEEDMEDRQFNLIRAHLECGHYVDLNRKYAPKRWKCCICQSQKTLVLTASGA